MKLLLLFFIPVFGFGQTKADTTASLFNDKVQIHVPKELTKMSDEMWKIKYHNLQRPELVLTDTNGEINLLVDLTQQSASENQLGDYKNFRVSNLKKTRTDVKVLSEGAKTVNGRKIIFVKFSTQASDQGIFNFYFFAILNGKILQFTFNCIEKQQGTWEKKADEILTSIKIK